jgi:hypothetical protein
VDSFGTPPPRYFEDHAKELMGFRNDYIEYVNRVAPGVLAGGPLDHSSERTMLRQASVKAQRAMNASGVELHLIPPPVAAGKPVLNEFQQIAFAWEDPTYQAYEGPQAFELAVDAMDAALAELALRAERAERLRRRPTYWIDRFLRAILGFPAYLISVILAFDRRDLPEGAGRALWILSVLADVGGVYALGSALGWW